eukprot:3713974-Rhodomonas_salina.2
MTALLHRAASEGQDVIPMLERGADPAGAGQPLHQPRHRVFLSFIASQGCWAVLNSSAMPQFSCRDTPHLGRECDFSCSDYLLLVLLPLLHANHVCLFTSLTACA